MASEVVRELITKWGFEIDDKPLEHLNEAVEDMKEKVIELGLHMAEAALTIFEFAHTTAESANEARLTATKLGLATDELQRLQFAAKMSEVNVESFNNGLRLLNRNIYDASVGNGEAIKTFQRLGITYRDGNGRLLTTDKVLEQLNAKFAAMPEGPKRTALAMEAFGRSGADLLPFLTKSPKQIAEFSKRAEELGLVMSEETIVASEKFQESWTESLGVLTGVRNIVGAGLLPVLTELMHNFTEYVIQNRKLIATRVTSFLTVLAKFLELTWKFCVKIVDAMGGVLDVFGGFERVATALGVALAIFAAGSILSGIGTLALAAWELVAAFGAADAAALAIPIGIGLAIVALGLIIEDVISFFQGKDSVTGVVVDAVKSAFWAAINAISGWLTTLANKAYDFAKGIADAFVGAFKPISDLLTKGANMIARFAGSAIGVNLATASSAPTVGAAMGMSPSTAPASSGGNMSSTQQNKIDMPITVTVGDAGNAAEVGRAVRGGAQEGLDSVLRSTARTYQGAGGH